MKVTLKQLQWQDGELAIRLEADDGQVKQASFRLPQGPVEIEYFFSRLNDGIRRFQINSGVFGLPSVNKQIMQRLEENDAFSRKEFEVLTDRMAAMEKRLTQLIGGASWSVTAKSSSPLETEVPPVIVDEDTPPQLPTC
jgi:hypothetical protein